MSYCLIYPVTPLSGVTVDKYQVKETFMYLREMRANTVSV